MKKILFALFSVGTLAAAAPAGIPVRVQGTAVEAVVFDWGDVLAFNSREIVVDFFCGTFRFSKEAFEAANLEKREAAKQGKSEVEFWLSYAKNHQIELDPHWPEKYEAALQQSIGVCPDMFSLVEELKQKQIRVAILSNIDDRYTALIRRFGYYEPFEPCLLSCEIGLSKPDQKSYELLLDELKIAPGKIVFIDDKEINCEAARKLGIDAIRFESPSQVRNELNRRGL